MFSPDIEQLQMAKKFVDYLYWIVNFFAVMAASILIGAILGLTMPQIIICGFIIASVLCYDKFTQKVCSKGKQKIDLQIAEQTNQQLSAEEFLTQIQSAQKELTRIKTHNEYYQINKNLLVKVAELQTAQGINKSVVTLVKEIRSEFLAFFDKYNELRDFGCPTDEEAAAHEFLTTMYENFMPLFEAASAHQFDDEETELEESILEESDEWKEFLDDE
jgi:hypothetical protein